MLSQPRISVLDADTSEVEEWLAPDAVLACCREQLTSVQPDIRDGWKTARRMEAIYHPGRHVRAAFALTSDADIADNRLWPEAQIVYVNAPVRRPMTRRGVVVRLGEMDAELYRFPNDRRLRGLRKFAGRAATAAVWQRWIDRQDVARCLLDTTLQRLLVRYVPEQKWIVRLRAETHSRGSGETRKERIAIRCAHPDRIAFLRDVHERLQKNHQSLENRSQGAASFRIPKLIGGTADGMILGVEWLRGETLLDMLQGGDAGEVLGSIAGRLKVFHESSIPDLTAVTPQSLNLRLDDQREHLAEAMPDYADEITEVTLRLVKRIGLLDPHAAATIHNDFHFGQLTIKRDRFVLHDLDCVALGDPLIDVANFATQLVLLGHRREFGVSSDVATGWKDTFLDHWCRETGGAPSPERIACYSALSAIQLAHGMMRHLRAGWRDLVRTCVRLASSQLDSVDS